MLFEAALGISAGLLMRMQLDYNMATDHQRQIFYGTSESSTKVCRIAVDLCAR